MQDFYPLFKWGKELNLEGVQFTFYRDHESKKLSENDVIFISHRYLRHKVYQSREFDDETFIIPFLKKIKQLNKRVVLFDYMAGSGCRYFNLIEYVDIIVKRQLLRDREAYLGNPQDFIKPYIWSYNLTDDERMKYEEVYSSYKPCPNGSLHKLELGWNTGMVDHRYFPFSRYYPFSTEKLFNSFYKKPSFEKVNKKRPNGAVFRGQLKNDKVFSFQRNQLISIMKEIDPKYDSFSGSKVSKREYIKELKNSKVCVSPFGWGEVCYRDFEAAIYGCVLIKPNMDHIETWPDIFNESETYIPVSWDMSDAKERLIDTIENYDTYKNAAINLQEYFSSQLENSDYIVNKIKKFCGI
jgi:hypothetical protein